MGQFVSKLSFFYMVVALIALMTASPLAYSQSNDPQDPENPVASDSENLGASSSPQSIEEPEATDGFTQTEDSRTLQEKIKFYNSEFCPPQNPITQINQNALAMLIEFQLLNRTELDKYENMVLINGDVYEKKDPGQEQEPIEPPRQNFDPTDKNLYGSFEQACIEVENEKTRGKGKGTRDPEKNINLRRKTITYRDKENKLQRMIIFYPEALPSKRTLIKGKTQETLKDYATSVLVPKQGEFESVNTDAFEDKPSVDRVEEPKTKSELGDPVSESSDDPNNEPGSAPDGEPGSATQ